MTYTPSDKTLWTGREDATRYHQVVECCDLRYLPAKFENNSFGIIGFACDEGVKRNGGRVGAKDGPKAFRCAFANLPTNHTRRVYDFGDILCKDGNLETAQKNLADGVAILIKHGITPIVIGGGHELAWGQFLGYAQTHPHQSCSIVNYDAHYDIRPLTDPIGNSGTPFRQIYNYCQSEQLPFDYTCVGISRFGNTQSLHDEADKMGVKRVYSDEVSSEIKISAERDVYLSLCLDVFSSAHAPGVSAPQPLGVMPMQLLPSMIHLMNTGKVAMVGIAELNPKYDVDNCTAKLAAQIVNTLISQPQY